jgi:ribosome-associated protein
MARLIVDALEDKKGEDILLIDLREICDFTDYFVLCTGTSDRMLQALADGAAEKVHAKYDTWGRMEGVSQEGWLLVDFGDVVLHLFSPDRRQYYRLEELWGRGKVLLRLQ